ncbi:fluoride efflux transporter FluC [Weissella soli]|uniref:fluoride efflux transporter FluC n=1 Tax=Weissella soli TaxID=155866 RepID=UPI003C7425BC
MMVQVVMAGGGAFFGSIGRYALLQWAPKWFGKASKWMVMVINLSAAFLIGLAYGLKLGDVASAFWMAGILGGYSTFSAPIIELVDALQAPSELPLVVGKTVLAFAGGLPVLMAGIWVAQNL